MHMTFTNQFLDLIFQFNTQTHTHTHTHMHVCSFTELTKIFTKQKSFNTSTNAQGTSKY